MKNFSLITRRCLSDIQKQGNVALENVERSLRVRAATPFPQSFAGIGHGEKSIYLPKNLAELAALNGMPKEHAERTVTIAQRPYKTVQVGTKYAEQWQITWESTGRWTNPLMGWTSTADPMSNVILNFFNKEDAIKFAQKNGWKYEVKEPQLTSSVEPGTYQYEDNFLPHVTKKRLAEQGLKNKIWDAPGWGQSNWFMPLKYHGDGPVEQHGPKQQK